MILDVYYIKSCNIFFLQLVEARYRFEVRVLSFANPSNTDRNGLRCDPANLNHPSCDYTFRFCLDVRGAVSSCIYGSINTNGYIITAEAHNFTVGQELIPGSGIPNPLVFTDVVQSTGNPWPVSALI